MTSATGAVDYPQVSGIGYETGVGLHFACRDRITIMTEFASLIGPPGDCHFVIDRFDPLVAAETACSVACCFLLSGNYSGKENNRSANKKQQQKLGRRNVFSPREHIA
jgi:hypothetical protein